jgi:glycosyltransferase involved in cell wall biosynthesis
MKIAVLGGRGVPARYGGYDTLIEELSIGLVKRHNIQVLVYCRKQYYKHRVSNFHGVDLHYLPAPKIKAIESLFHSFISTIDVLKQGVDLIYFVDPANAPFCLLLRLFNKRVIFHTNGLGWKRHKWGPLARRYYKFVEWLVSRTANALVTDNPVMKKYYIKEYEAESFYIQYGAKSRYGVDSSVYSELGFTPNEYLLVVARLEPENNTDLIIQEYIKTKASMPLVIVGDSPYNPSFMEKLRILGDSRVHFVGRVNNQPKLNALYKGAYLYIHGHGVGGTNPSLLRAMQAGAAPLVIDIPFNTAVVQNAGFVFKKEKNNLRKIIEYLVTKSSEVAKIGNKAKNHVEENFKWETVVEKHAKIILEIANKEKNR